MDDSGSEFFGDLHGVVNRGVVNDDDFVSKGNGFEAGTNEVLVVVGGDNNGEFGHRCFKYLVSMASSEKIRFLAMMREMRM